MLNISLPSCTVVAVYMPLDESGNSAKVTIKDVYQSNGVIHVIDTVLMPKS